jgi:uncharacterized repeat protein (TIGR03803 family)
MKKQYFLITVWKQLLKGRLFFSICIAIVLSTSLHAQTNIMGVTDLGGSGNSGQMFSIDTSLIAKYTSYHSFTNGSGVNPRGNLVKGSDGLIYGMASTGGSVGDSGAIFTMNLQTNAYNGVYLFSKAAGFSPYGSLIEVGGNFYGMTHFGGANDKGVIFKFNLASKTYTDIHDFALASGSNPDGSLAFYNGVLYGMTNLGGAKDSGVIFSIDTATLTYTDVVDLGGKKGGLPIGDIIITPTNKFLALTSAGGVHDSGSVILFDPIGKTVTDEHDFTKATGCFPNGNLVWGGSKLYGMTKIGGAHDSGTIFSLDPSTYTYTKLFDFTKPSGNYPFGTLMLASNGDLYGMTSGGGANKDGVIFRMDTTTYNYQKVADFTGNTGAYPGKSPFFTQLLEVCIPPKISLNAGNGKICAGGDTSFTVSATALSGATVYYQWEVNTGSGFNNITNAGVYSGANTNSLKISGGTTAMNGYIYRCVTNAGCTDSSLTSADTLWVNGFTSVSISDNVIGGSSICTGMADTLTATATGGSLPYTYKWTTGSVSDTTLIKVSGTYKVIIKDKNGCADSASQAITVNPDPVITITSSPVNDTVCKGSSVTLSGNGALSYSWNNGITNATPFIPAVSGKYVVTGTDVNGCKAKDSVNVTVDTVIVNLHGNVVGGFNICGSGNDTVTAGATSGIGKLTYSWSTAGTNDSVIVHAAATYSVTVTDAKGCKGVATATVTITANPTVGITSNPVNDTVCAGSPMTLSGSGASTYSWNNGITNAVAFTPAISGTKYIVTGTDVNGCKGKDSVVVGIRTLPTVSITSTPVNDTVCKGSSVTLNATGTATTYAWNNGITNNTPFVPAATAKYVVTATDQFGCKKKDSVRVKVDTVIVSLKGNVVGGFNICGGGNDTITANTTSSIGKLSYAWSTSGTQDSIIPHVAGTYSVTITDAKGCMGIGSATVAISSNPTITITSNPANDTVCAGSTITLSGNGGVSYTWNNGVTNGVAFAPAVTGTKYIVTGKNGSGCVAKDSVVVGVRTLPTVSVASTPSNDTVCKGSSVTLNATGNALSYTWNNGITNNTAFVPTASAKYIVSGPDKFGCTVKDTVNVTVDTVMVVLKGNVNGGFNMCGGGNDTLMATTSSSIGKLTYQWSTTGTKDSIIVHGAGTYSIMVTDAKGCKGNASATVAVTTAANITITSAPANDTVCMGSSITLSGAGGVSYSWSNGITNGVAFTPVASGVKYIVNGTDSKGCKGKDSVVVGVRALPTVSITSAPVNDTVCKGSPITLSGTGAVSYTWSNGITNAVAFKPAASGKYVVTGTDKYGCVNKDSVHVDVDTVMVVLTGNTVGGYNICNHGNDTIKASETSGIGKFTYVWSTTGTQDTAIAHTGGTYSVTVTDAKGCKGIAKATVTTKPDPVLSILAIPLSDSICPGGLVTLTASGATSYSWNNGVSNGVSFSPANSATYIVTGTGANGCTAKDSVSIGIKAVPVVTITGQSTVNPGTNDTLHASGATSYSWAPTGGTNDTIIVAPTKTTTYTVTGTASDGCSASATFTVNAVVGIENITSGNSISLYPNPVMNVMNLTFTTSTASTDAVVNVIDMLGNKMAENHTTITNGKNLRMDISTLPQGVYFVQVVTNNGTQVVRFIKQ